MKTNLFYVVLSLLFFSLVACSDSGNRVPGGEGFNSDSGLNQDGALIDDAGADSALGPNADNCVEGTEWIYALDKNGDLYKFDPRYQTLTPAGTFTIDGTINSFAIDEDGSTWINGSDQKMYLASLENRNGTRKSVDASDGKYNQSNNIYAGMAFIRQSDENTRLFLGLYEQGGVLGLSTGSSIAWIDTKSSESPLPLTRLGEFLKDHQPELAGTPDGELWGFFPEGNNAFLGLIDQNTGKIGRTIKLNPNIPKRAWAFAFWGNRFYVFFVPDGKNHTSIWEIKRDTGEQKEVVSDTGSYIVGAAESPCVPEEFPPLL